MQKDKFFTYFGRDREEVLWCCEFCRTHWPEETEHILKIARDVTNHRFLFDLPWDMEQTKEPVLYGEEIQWDYQPGEDPEYIYQMNRHRYWICLGQAHLLTGEEGYAEEFVRQMTSWLAANPITEDTKKTTWRTIEAGIRGENWVKAMSYFKDSPAVTDEVWRQFEQGLILHGEYLADCRVPFSIKSNWGVLENHGLYLIGKALECDRYAKTALERLAQEARIQVMDDGVHWEQSPMYHNEVLKCFLEVIRTAKQFRDQIPEVICRTAERMALVNLAWMKPSHMQPEAGDSDETDLRDILTVSACQFQDGRMKFGGYDRLDYEGAWDYGRAGQEACSSLEAREPKTLFTELKDSGNWYLRSGWSGQSDYFHFKCGILGGGHGHFDKLHIDLSVNGEDILIDPGRFTYVDSPIRRSLKGALSHSVPYVDDREYTDCLDSWGVSGMTLAVNRSACQKGAFSYFCGAHLGYQAEGIFVNRQVIAIGTRIFVISDTFTGSGNHTFSQGFQLNSTGKAGVEDNVVCYQGQQADLVITPVTPGAHAELRDSCISRHYNEIEDTSRAVIRADMEAPFSLITVIVGYDKETSDRYQISRVPVTAPVTGRVLTDREAGAVRIRNGQEDYVAVISHTDAGADCEYISALGIGGLGRVMVCDLGREEPDPSMTVLCW